MNTFTRDELETIAYTDSMVLETINIPLVEPKPGHGMPVWNTDKTSWNTINDIVNNFNEKTGYVAGELGPDYTEPEYSESHYAHINKDRFMFIFYNLTVDENGGFIFADVAILNKPHLFDTLNDIAENKAPFSFGCRMLTLADNHTVTTADFVGVDLINNPENLSVNTFTSKELNTIVLEEKQALLSKEPLPIEAIRTMVTLQDSMNTQINANWIEVRNPFIRAVIMEGAEAMDHYGWKWWKKQTSNVPQVKIEMVDIWHFYLSEIILACEGDIELAVGYTKHHLLVSDMSDTRKSPGFLTNMETIINLATHGIHSISQFNNCLLDIGMTWDELYRLYIGKNVLNRFRQENGYKEGTYEKTWAGKEDNDHLTEIIYEGDIEDPTFQENVHVRLTEKYHSVFSDPA